LLATGLIIEEHGILDEHSQTGSRLFKLTNFKSNLIKLKKNQINFFFKKQTQTVLSNALVKCRKTTICFEQFLKSTKNKTENNEVLFFLANLSKFKVIPESKYG